MKQTDNAYQIVWLVRRLFRALAQTSDNNLQDLGISAADRAVLEFLFPDKELSVPELAERYQVSRQHVQTTVNNLHGLGLLTTKDNPRHKRSSLMVLTSKGKALFRKVMLRDTKAITRLFENIADKDTAVTRKTLETLLAELR